MGGEVRAGIIATVAPVSHLSIDIDFTKQRFLRGIRDWFPAKPLLLMSRVGLINRHIARSVIDNTIGIELRAQHIFNHRVMLV